MIKKLVVLIFIISILTMAFNYAALDLENPDHISTLDIKREVLLLAKDYPEYIDLEVIGYSTYNQPIYVIRLSNKIHEMPFDESYNKNKKHSLYLAGLHAKEVIAPVAFLKIIRDNLEKLTSGHEELNSIFESQVIHFIPLANPDGFQLAKFSDKHDLFGENFNKAFKANARGVDLNRNFPDRYFDIDRLQWRSIKETAYKLSPNLESIPGLSNYPGDKIESETQTIMDYMDRFYFEYYIDIHSQGNYIYWDHWYLSKAYRDQNEIFANYLSRASRSSTNNGYTLEPVSPYDEEHAYGYSTAYFANRYSNPALTLEVSLQKHLPHTHTSDYVDVINRFKDIFIEFSNYNDYKYPHRVYQTTGIFGDYQSEAYAKAIAKEINGHYIYDENSIKEPESIFLTINNYNMILSIIKATDFELIEETKYLTYELLATIGLEFKKSGPVTIYDFIYIILPVIRDKGVENL